MNTVTGFRAQRLSRGLTIRQLAQSSGLSPYTIRCCEEGNWENCSLCRLLALADALGVSLAEGCRVREVSGSRIRPRRRAPRNLLENYMAYWEMTLQGMALILGVSVQTVSVQCGLSHPAMKYIRLLAEEEHMTVDSFLTMYGDLNIA